jgi:hypothetical protein
MFLVTDRLLDVVLTQEISLLKYNQVSLSLGYLPDSSVSHSEEGCRGAPK